MSYTTTSTSYSHKTQDFRLKYKTEVFFVLAQRCRYWYERGWCPFDLAVAFYLDSVPSLTMTLNSGTNIALTTTTEPKFAQTFKIKASASTDNAASFATLRNMPTAAVGPLHLSLHVRPLVVKKCPVTATRTATRTARKDTRKD